MSWIREHKRTWRLAFLVLVPVTFAGPWGYDLLSVPAEHTCSPPAIRLGGDWCGWPMSGLGVFRWGISGLARSSVALLSGEMTFVDWGKGCLLGLLPSLILLPLFGTLLLILFGDRPRRQVFGVVAWALAAAFGLLIGLSRSLATAIGLQMDLFGYLRHSWVLWGVWLYTVLAVKALVLEALTLKGQGDTASM